MKTLHLNLEKKWFDMILSDQKPEEYRTIKFYWVQRLFYRKEPLDFMQVEEFTADLKKPFSEHRALKSLLEYWQIEFREFDTIIFRNGYQKNARTLEVKFCGIEVRTGKKEWGAVPGENYFVIKIEKL